MDSPWLKKPQAILNLSTVERFVASDVALASNEIRNASQREQIALMGATDNAPAIGKTRSFPVDFWVAR